MRRSRRYREKPRVIIDLESAELKSYGHPHPIVTREITLSAEDQRKRAKKGWLNWHMNRGRLPISALDDEIAAYKRRVSWRRVH
jgi:hypothetical protein